MSKPVYQLQANICKALSHPKRLEVLCELKAGEKSFGELQEVTGLSKANLSQHLAILRERGVVSARREGQQLFLSIANPKITQACELMHEVLFERIQAQQEAANTE